MIDYHIIFYLKYVGRFVILIRFSMIFPAIFLCLIKFFQNGIPSCRTGNQCKRCCILCVVAMFTSVFFLIAFNLVNIFKIIYNRSLLNLYFLKYSFEISTGIFGNDLCIYQLTILPGAWNFLYGKCFYFLFPIVVIKLKQMPFLY